MQRIKIFSGKTDEELEDNINNFLRINPSINIENIYATESSKISGSLFGVSSDEPNKTIYILYSN